MAFGRVESVGTAYSRSAFPKVASIQNREGGGGGGRLCRLKLNVLFIVALSETRFCKTCRVRTGSSISHCSRYVIISSRRCCGWWLFYIWLLASQPGGNRRMNPLSFYTEFNILIKSQLKRLLYLAWDILRNEEGRSTMGWALDKVKLPRTVSLFDRPTSCFPRERTAADFVLRELLWHPVIRPSPRITSQFPGNATNIYACPADWPAVDCGLC